jgi:penicillin-binding protein 2
MFERRMLIVGIVFAVVLGGMAARLFSLTVVMGSQQRALADSRLDHSTLLATVRGSIIDRKGRVLAKSVPSYDVAIFYPAINGAWADTRAIAAAKKAAGRAAWNRLGPAEREERIQAHRQELAAELELVLNEVAKACHMTRDELSAEMGSVRMHVEKKASAVWEARLEIDRAKYGEDAEEQFDAQPIAEQSEAHVVKSGIETASAFVLRKLADAHPGTIEVQDSTRRVYPWASARIDLDRSSMPRPLRGGTLKLDVQGIADHVIGGIREEVWRQDLDRRPFRVVDSAGDVAVDLGGYRPGHDMVGSYGIERTYEDLLRGKRGRTMERVNTKETTRTEPVLGSDLQLTLDIALQARVQALFMPEVGLALAQQWHYGWDNDETPKKMLLNYLAPLNGAAVVIDVDTGEILSMVSWPTVAAGEDFDDVVRAARNPSLNRAIEGSYPPGSIIKPIVYVSAVRSGVFGADDQIECNGHFFGEGDSFGRCWIYRKQYNFQTHSKAIGGPLDVEAAISRSCNIYFYTIAQRMGLRTLTDWYRNFGLGQNLDIGIARWEPRLDKAGNKIGDRLSGEHPGVLPSAQAIAKIESTGDRMVPAFAGVGQGPILWTPMQAANAYATLARGGVIRDAELLRTPIPGRAARRTGDWKLNPHSCDRAFEGLRQSVEERHGTGNRVSYKDKSAEAIINAPGVVVWAKTGTAQAPPLKVDDDGNGTIDRTITGLDHAWFVGLVGDAQEPRPRYAVAVLLEHGGSGGKSAGPIANQVIRALISEGYLQGDPHSRPARKPLQPIGADDIEPTGGAG